MTKDFKKLVDTGAIEKCKVNELKDYLKANGVSQTGEKGTLIFRIKAHLDGEKMKVDGKNPTNLKLAELKKACAQRGLSPIGSNDELLESLMRSLRTHGGGISGGEDDGGGKEGPASSSKENGSSSSGDGDVANSLIARIIELSEGDHWTSILSLGQQGITRDSPTAMLRKAYYRLSLLVHPDRCKVKEATKAFQAVVTAFERLSEPEPEEEHPKGKGRGKQAEAKVRSISRSNEGCFRTQVFCPRCKTEWGLPIDGLPTYTYNYFMMGLKTYCCSTCLLDFGALTAIHKCPFCRRPFEYDPHDYHRHIVCGNKGCSTPFGFMLYTVSDRVEKEMRAQLKVEQEQRLKQRESKLARLLRSKRKAGEGGPEDDARLKEKMFLHGLLDECPRCGESPECAPEAREAHRDHLRHCKDQGKIQAHQKKRRLEEARREESEKKKEKQEDMQSLRTFEFLGGISSDMWLLTDGELARQCEEKLGSEEKEKVAKMTKDQMITKLVSHGQGQMLLTDGGKKGSAAKGGAAKKKAMTLESLPSNLHQMSASQLTAVCAAHGFFPRTKTQCGIVKEIEKKLAESEEGHEEIYMIED